MDLYRSPRGDWLIKLEIAGIRPEDIRVELRDRTLTIRGRRRDWAIDEELAVYRMEIQYCEFERQIELPCEVGSAEIDTEIRDGMLLIHLRERRISHDR